MDLDAEIPASTQVDLRKTRAEARAQSAEARAQMADEPFDDIVLGKMLPCPICGKQFHEDLLERHASECTDFPTEDEPPLQLQADHRATRNRQVCFKTVRDCNMRKKGIFTPRVCVLSSNVFL